MRLEKTPQLLLTEIFKVISNSKEDIFNPSLLDGSFSKILFLTHYDFAHHRKASKTTVEGINNIFSYVQDSLKYPDKFHSFHTGMHGALWLLKHIEKQTNFIEIDKETNSVFSNYCFQSAIGNLRSSHFDLLFGGIGNSMYMFEECEIDKLIYLEKVLYRTVKENKEGSLIWLSQLLDGSNERGEYLGLAHGAASILAFYTKLSKFQKKGEADLRGICNKIIENILSHKRTNELGLFPSQVAINSKYQNLRLAWCHGDLGIAAAIFNAGVTFNNKIWLNKAYDILFHIYKNRSDLDENGIYDANVCHGAAGVAHIFNKVFQYSKIPEFKDATEFWMKNILLFAKYEDGLAGFKTMDHERGLINNTGLLNGISGVGLVLFSCLYPDADLTWDRCLLLS